MNITKIYYILFFIFFHIKLISNTEIKVIATNQVFVECENGLYFVNLKVNFTSSFDKYYSFALNLESPLELKLKCLMIYENETILCFGNLNSNKFDLEIGEFIQFPKFFPKIEDITWDYDSFVKYIYSKEWIIENDCLQKNFDNNFLKEEWGFVYNITNVYENRCSYSINAEENKYNFKMKLNIYEGNLKNQIENSNNNDNNMELEFLQDIWVPILLNSRRSFYKKIDDFSFAFCSLKEKVSKSNLNSLMRDGFNVDCYIPIPEGKLLFGAIQILPFYDYLYLKINKNENTEIIFDKFYFNINRTLEQTIEIGNKLRGINEDNNETETNETENSINENNNEANTEQNGNGKEKNSSINDNNKDNNEKNGQNENESKNTEIKNLIKLNYFLIGDIDNKIYCPDKPIFIIKESNQDIKLLSSEYQNYTFGLKGKLTNGLQEIDNKYVSMNELYDEISFSLIIIDNLAENEDNQKAEAICTIPARTPFYKNITIICLGNKISEESMNTNDTDIILNWNIEKNRLHEDIIINWPEEKRKIKHMYFYNIEGFSLVQRNFGCFNNEFYFYIYIYDLAHEPDITFEIQMKNPNEPKAICKIYQLSILKCYFPLYQQKLEKNTRIDLPTNYTFSSIDGKGNKVIFKVEDYDFDYEDFHITVRQTCGDTFIVGALKKAGFDIFKIFLIVIGIGIFTFIVFVCAICYIYYKIKNRYRKGNYIKHIEEDANSIQMKVKKVDNY